MKIILPNKTCSYSKPMFATDLIFCNNLIIIQLKYPSSSSLQKLLSVTVD